MRGEPSAIGIATKRSPVNHPASFFSDTEYRDDLAIWHISHDLRKAVARLEDGYTVVIPSAGIGTGLARLPEKAPLLYAFLDTFL